jgi:hypothetical protein
MNIFKPCLSGLYFAARLPMVLEGRRIASGASRERKVRTPKGVMPRNPGSFGWDTRGRKVERLFDGQCHRKLNRRRRKLAVRVKRCGKSAPREAQATRHGKPHRVQGQIGNPGAARSRFRPASRDETDSGYRLHRQMILSPVPHCGIGADRIRLTALPRPIQISKPGGTSPTPTNRKSGIRITRPSD